MTQTTADHTSSRPPTKLTSVAAGLIAGVPVAWVLGLDQLVWLLGGALLGAHLLGRRDAPRLLLVLVGLFLVIAAVSGVLSAEGVRWATLARDLAIALSFFATLFGIAALVASNRSVRWIVAAVTLVLSISSVLSIIVFVIQDPLRFTTPIAPLVPEWIARTVLGATSLTSRSLGTPSYLFGTEFLRPNGLFLFSTSQAVAQATFLPMMVAAARTHREWRWWFVAAIGVNVVGLVLTTTRASIAAVIVGLALVWFIRRWMVGYVRVEIPLNRRSAPVLAGILLLFVVGAVGIGATGPLVDFVTARSGDSRGTLYDATIAWWREKPILGWGTVVDNVPTPTPVSSATPTPRVSPTPRPTPTPVPTPVVTPRPLTPEELPPLGSHSQYLGVLFKQGVVGIVLFLAVVAVTARYAWALLRRPRPGSDLVVAAFVSSLVAGITEEFWLDPGAALAVGIVWGLVVAGGRRALARRAENPIPDQSESPILT